jgi:uncharacterized protein (DUF2252 family)
VVKTAIQTAEHRRQAGKSLRDRCPRQSHGKAVARHGNTRDIVALIKASNKDRVENLVPIRHGRMLQSEFAFFRGTAALQAYDLAGTPRSRITVQACGDCHLMNFGGFATPERNLVFDINDFDETFPAPFEWDLKRLAASFVIAARWRGFRSDQARQMAVEAVSSYRQSMKRRAAHGVLEGWYSRMTLEDVRAILGDDEDIQRQVSRKAAEAQKQTSERVANKITAPTSRGRSRIVDQPPLLYHADKREVNKDSLAAFFNNYRKTLAEGRRALFDRFELVEAAVKVVGVGSVGTRCYVALFLAAPDDPLFLQVKEARRSVLEPYLRRSSAAHNGQRVVVGQRLMQSSGDIFLGWSRGPGGRDFYVRQLRDMKVSADIEKGPRMMRAYATPCGRALARAHDKAGDAAMIAGYLGGSDEFDEALADYAVGYADQSASDHASFVRAVRAGQLSTDVRPGRLEMKWYRGFSSSIAFETDWHADCRNDQGKICNGTKRTEIEDDWLCGSGLGFRAFSRCLPRRRKRHILLAAWTIRQSGCHSNDPRLVAGRHLLPCERERVGGGCRRARSPDWKIFPCRQCQSERGAERAG